MTTTTTRGRERREREGRGDKKGCEEDKLFWRDATLCSHVKQKKKKKKKKGVWQWLMMEINWSSTYIMTKRHYCAYQIMKRMTDYDLGHFKLGFTHCSSTSPLLFLAFFGNDIAMRTRTHAHTHSHAKSRVCVLNKNPRVYTAYVENHNTLAFIITIILKNGNDK